MARHLWDGDFAQFWFGFRSPLDRRVRRQDPLPDDMGPAEADQKPVGIVERNRRARRGKWVLRSTR